MIPLLVDNLNIHTPSVLYEVFPPQEARRIIRKLDFHYTPKHASWLNQVEIELSVLSRQCLELGIPNVEILSSEIAISESQRNQRKPSVYWVLKPRMHVKKCSVYIRVFNPAKLPWQTTRRENIS